MFRHVPQNHTNFGDALVVLSQAREVGGASEIPHGDIVIEVKQDGETLATTHIDDNDGLFEFTLLYGNYEVVASFFDQDGNKWNCVNTLELDKTQETLIVPCYDKQYSYIPFTSR